ncbi:hypothetical protein LXL04_016302 [Taraxacum kok-saghyz]
MRKQVNWIVQYTLLFRIKPTQAKPIQAQPNGAQNESLIYTRSNYTSSLVYTVDIDPRTNLTVHRVSPTHAHPPYRTPPSTTAPFPSISTLSRQSAAVIHERLHSFSLHF